MPRKCVLPHTVIFDKIGGLPFWDDDGKLKTKSDPVWAEAYSAVEKKMSIAYIYLYISGNRNNIVQKIVEKYGIEIRERSDVSKDLDGTNDSNWSTHETAGRLPFKSLRTKLTIDEHAWKSIEPRLVEYEGEQKFKLQTGWTDVFYEAIWEQLKLPCAFSFRSESIKMSDGIFLTVHAYCTECGSEFNAYALRAPDPHLQLYVSTYDTRRIIHHKKRQLKSSRRRAVGEQLAAGTSTYALRRRLARDKMDFGGQEPADLHSEQVYRKAKQEFKDTELAVTGFVDPILSIQKLKYGPEYTGFIREVGLDKFYVIYFSEHQTDLYKRYLKDSKVGHLSVDSTGSMWAPIKRPDGNGQPIQLYQLVVPFCDKILPVCQLITEKHDAVFISYWLKEWLRHNIPVPKSIVSDFAFALLNACSMAFNEKTLGKYVEGCIKYLLQTPDSSVLETPTCLILVDIAHLIASVARWSCWTNVKPKKMFFLRCIGLLTKASTLNIFLTTLQDVLLVAMSEYSSFDPGHSCTEATQRLLGVIGTTAFPYEIADEGKRICLEENFQCDANGYEFATRFVDNIITETKKFISPGPIGNPNYCPDFLKKFQILLKFFPLWTIVMPDNPILVSSSARSEEYFRELKKLSLVDKKQRVDKALIKHIQNIQGTMKILRAEYEKRVDAGNENTGKENQPRKKEKKMIKPIVQDEPATSHSPVLPSRVRSEDIFNYAEKNAKEERKADPQRRNMKSTPRKFRRVFIKDNGSGEDDSCDEDSDVSLENDSDDNDRGEYNNEKENHLSSARANHQAPQKQPFTNPLRDLNPHSPRNSSQKEDNSNYSPTGNPISTSSILEPENQVPGNDGDGDDMYRNDLSGTSEKARPKPNQRSLLSSSSSFVESSTFRDETTGDAAQETGPDSTHKSHQQDFNAVDDWMGKLSDDAKRRGLYLEPCPDIISLQQRPSQKRKIPFLKNGNILSSIRLAKRDVSVQNTCAFDSLAQSLLIAYRDSSSYQKYMQQSTNELFRFILILHEVNQPGFKIYKERMMLMKALIPIKQGSLNCAINIGTLIQKLLINEPSWAVEATCSRCSKVSKMNHVTLEIPFGPVHLHGISKLEQILDEMITKSPKCKKCSSVKIEVGKSPGKQLFVDLEICMSIKVARECGYKDWTGLFTIAQLPEKIQFHGRTYHLSAAIEYEGPIDLPPGCKGMGHYIAHVHRIDGRWNSYNDISRVIAPPKMSSRELCKKRKIPLIIYCEK